MPSLGNNRVYPGYMNKHVHSPECRCRNCKRKKRVEKMEYKLATYMFYSVFFILLAIG